MKNSEEKTREKIQRLLVTGDNRLKQGVDPEKARQSFLQALELAIAQRSSALCLEQAQFVAQRKELESQLHAQRRRKNRLEE